MKKILSLLIACVMLTGLTVVRAEDTRIKNIIYMIPDGGGMAPLELANAVKNAGGLNSQGKYPYASKTTEGDANLYDYLAGAVTTYSADAEVTDSAAAGTALSTGIKTKNGYIGVDENLKPQATILEMCQLAGKATGMVTTYDWANATPAAFSSHDNSRSNNGMIAEQVVNQKIDVVLGVGFDMSGGVEVSDAKNRGYNIINNRTELENVKKGDKIWGNLESREFPYEIDNTAETVTLPEMTKAAICALSDANENGFFLMVEGSRVDGGGHANNAMAMTGEFLAFDEAFRIAVEYAKGRNDTIVIACPDHDTGGMILPEELEESVAAIQDRIQPEAVIWEGTSHTARNGGLFIYAPGGVAFPAGIDTASVNPFEENVIDNTDVVKYLTGLLGYDKAAITKELFKDVTEMGKYDGVLKAFVFENYPVIVPRNASYAYIGDKAADLDGQVSVYIDGKFYVPQKLFDIIEGREDIVPYDVSLVYSALTPVMKSFDETYISLDIRSFLKDETVSGMVKFTKPEGFAKLDAKEFTITADMDKAILDFEEVMLSRDGEDFAYDIILDNGSTYSFEEKVSGVLYAAYTDTPITVDGVIDEKQWEYAPRITCDDVAMLTNDFENWKGFRDLSATFSMLYDKENLYFTAVVTDEIFHQDQSADAMWNADCIQFGFYNDTEKLYKNKDAGTRYDGINFGHIGGEDIAYRSQRVNYLVDKGIMESDKLEFKTSRVNNDMTYEIKISWKELMGYDLNPKSGDMLAFSFLANDNDGEGRRGAIQYGSGIYGGKNVNQFVPVYLLNTQNFADADCTVESGLKVYVNNQQVQFENKPFIFEGRTVAPAEEILDAVGASYIRTEKGFVIDGEAPVIIGADVKIENSEIAPFYQNGILYMPLRAICENMGKTVFWRADTEGVYIK